MKVLVVDDEKNIRESIKKFLNLEEIDVVCAENGLSAKRLLEEEVFSAGVIDLKMPGMNGFELLNWIKKEGIRIPVIMISAYGEIQDAVEAIKAGANDYIVKPFDPEELTIRLKRIIDNNKLKNQVESGIINKYTKEPFTGINPGIIKIKKLIGRVAPTPSTVLITGESGSGKEVIARQIHNLSSVSDGPFISINIGGIQETLLESELFGHEKGAFTGAEKRKPGTFELASSGTLFLDEIGDMPLHLQVKLLRVLQERKIKRLGGIQNIPINARIISATNRDIEKKVKFGEFREDLFYRLNVIRIEVPPLREHLDDLPGLVGNLIDKFNKKMGKTITGINPEALIKLKNYYFPGNIRELENIIERAFIFTDSAVITETNIELRKKTLINIPKAATIKSVEKKMIINALHRWEGNRTRAAEELGVSRRTIINKINEYGISI